MQYPPTGDLRQSADAFAASLGRFLERLESAISGRRRPWVFWLTVTAVAEAKLPKWKRAKMNVAIARQYNMLASPMLQRLTSLVGLACHT